MTTAQTKYRSKLEAKCAKLLAENKIPFAYESKKFILQEGFSFEQPSYERVGKKKKMKFKLQHKRVRALTYTPDFMGHGWIIETKGFRTDSFNLKWKLFKKYLQDNNLNYVLFMPHTEKEIKTCITEIKKIIKNEITIHRSRDYRDKFK